MLEVGVHGAEARLGTDFVNMVGDLSLREVMVPFLPVAGLEWPHEPLENFSLCAIVGNNGVDEDDFEESPPYASLYPAYYDYTIIPSGGRAIMDPCICLDSMQAIGLVFEDAVGGFATGGVLSNGHGAIIQVQGPPPDRASHSAWRARHGGLQWEDTLLNSWVTIFRQLGIQTIDLRPDGYNTWSNTNTPDEAIMARYARLARRNNFNWDAEQGWGRLQLN